jgi:hypothetical protein
LKSPAPDPPKLMIEILEFPMKDREANLGISFNSEFEEYILISQVAGGVGSGGDASTALSSDSIVSSVSGPLFESVKNCHTFPM